MRTTCATRDASATRRSRPCAPCRWSGRPRSRSGRQTSRSRRWNTTDWRRSWRRVRRWCVGGRVIGVIVLKYPAQLKQAQAQVRRGREQRFYTTRRARSSRNSQFSPPLPLFPFTVLIALLSLSVVVKAESRGFLNNGRFFTAALAISNSPQPGRYVQNWSEKWSAEPTNLTMIALHMLGATL